MDTQEIDFLIATKIMGYDRLNYSDFGGYSPSQNISAAWQVVLKFKERCKIECGAFGWMVSFCTGKSFPDRVYGYDVDFSMAVCKAALATINIFLDEAKEEK